MNGVNKEILSHIISFVDMHDYPKCSCICNFWNSSLNDDFFRSQYYHAGGTTLNTNTTNEKEISWKVIFYDYMLRKSFVKKLSFAIDRNDCRLLSSLIRLRQLTNPLKLFLQNRIFLLVAKIGSIEITRTVLKELPDIRKDSKLEIQVPWSALQIAVFYYRLDMIKFLVEEVKVSVETTTQSNTETVLYNTINRIRLHFPPNYYDKKDKEDNDLFRLICKPCTIDSSNKIEVIEYLLKVFGNGAYAWEFSDPGIVNLSPMNIGNAFHWAIANKDMTLIKYFHDNFYPKAKSLFVLPNQEVINTANCLSRLFLIWDDFSYLLAAYQSSVDILFWLLTEGGMDVNSVSIATDCTILHHCIQDNKLDLARELISKYGAKVNCGHKYSEHILFHFNGANFDLNAYLFLREQGASIENTYRQQYLTHRFVSCLPMLKQLVADGISLEQKDYCGRTIADLVYLYSLHREDMGPILKYMNEINAPRSQEISSSFHLQYLPTWASVDEHVRPSVMRYEPPSHNYGTTKKKCVIM